MPETVIFQALTVVNTGYLPSARSQLIVSPGGLFLTLTQGRVGRVLRLPFGSDCARKTAAGQAEEFPHV
ncbi:hypothetical protein Tfer_3301 [Thermincola ferriacetica]|uniref:Uncharacterized protein n=1 Tax=Thermincola ferriacetica TaxID=281456 RepID=A0A0L6VY80_9FIRM|nr:hypothetical protein Tfer_3301 [Thermincola ferriacetica]